MRMDIGTFAGLADQQMEMCDTYAANELARRMFDLIVEAHVTWRDSALALATVAANLVGNASESGGVVDGHTIALPAVICLWTSSLMQADHDRGGAA